MIDMPYLFWIDIFFLGYFLSINLIYLILLFLGSLKVYFRYKELSAEDVKIILHSNSLPEITFIVPMWNEEKNILATIHNLFNLSYRYKQVIVVNDGSSDDSLEMLKKTYELIEIPNFYKEQIPTTPIKKVYRSKLRPELIVIDKMHTGKYDSLNAGINVCENPFFICIDADTIIDNTGFEVLVRPILTNPKVIAIGASIRIKNGTTLHFNRVSSIGFPNNLISAFQELEYLRSFIMRQGWNYVGGNVVFSGAFSIFSKDPIIKIGGFSPSIAEDMEIVIRLHKVMKETKTPYETRYMPDPIAWTEGPSSMKSLGKQRTNWHLGTLESLWYHKKICFNLRYGFFGIFNYPFWTWGEAFEPVFEFLGYTLIVLSWALGIINGSFFILIILVSYGFIFLFSVVCLLIEELSFKKYTSFKTLSILIFLSFIENFGYRQFTIFWRLRGFVRFIKTFKKIQKDAEKVRKSVKTAKESIHEDSNLDRSK